MTSYRYEIKFILNALDHARAKSWLYINTTARPVHSVRTVNSVYFDDTGYSAVRDNLAGISDRKKMRLRWYKYDDDDKEIRDLRFELKFRNGRLGRKEVFPLDGLNDNVLETEYKNMFAVVRQFLSERQVFVDDEFLFPALHVSYKREYYEALNGVRFTFDNSVSFYEPFSCSLPFSHPAISYPHTIMEVKFPMELKNEVAETIRSLSLTPKRHSKYLAGLAALGYTTYY